MHREKLPFPFSLFEQHVMALGKTRSGKSSALRLMVEHLLDRNHPVCIVDPKGDWWGIKLDRSGKAAGYPVVIFGGEHADVPINEYSGSQVAELFATGNRSMLIDLGGWMPGERTRFWIDFASTLFKLTRGSRTLVIDEVHNFAPKGRMLDPQSAKALHWTNRLASEGLGRGIQGIYASQRPQKVHNDLLTSCETLIAMRVIHPSDRDAIAEWIESCGDPKLGKEVLGTLAQSERGQAWAWAPEMKFGPKRIQFPMFGTYDSFKPQPAGKRRRLKGWAAVDLDEVKEKLAAVVQEHAANDPNKLKIEIAELRKKNAQLERIDRDARTTIPPPQPKVKPKFIPIKVLAKGEAERIEKMGAKLRRDLVEIYDSSQQRIAEAREEISAHLSRIEAKIGLIEEFDSGAAKELAEMDIRISPPTPAAVAAVVNPKWKPYEVERNWDKKTLKNPDPFGATVDRMVKAASNGIPGGEKETLQAVIESGDKGLTMSGICIHTRKALRSVQSYVSRLVTKQFVKRGDHSRVYATDLGRSAMPDVKPLPADPGKLQKHWLEHLPGGEVDLFRFLIAIQPNWPAVKELPEALGMALRTVQSYVSRLKTKEAIEVFEDIGGNRIKLAPELQGRFGNTKLEKE